LGQGPTDLQRRLFTINGERVGFVGEDVVMTRNHRRKQSARQHAARTGDRYVRARRTTEGAMGKPEPTAVRPMLEDDESALTFARLHKLQRVLEPRGWFAEGTLDEHGLATSLDDAWGYPAAFNGPPVDLADPDAPQIPACGLTFEEDDDGHLITIDTAGNWEGCSEHATVHYRLPMGDEGFAQLPQLLDDVEQHARSLDSAMLIECAETGPCGEAIVRRRASRQLHLDWSRSMVRAHDELLDDRQRAELSEWERAHLDGRSARTSDWPGWVPIIGVPPWRTDSGAPSGQDR
jgi:hypothetical protein